MFLNFIYSGDGNAEFSAAITPSLQFSHDPSMQFQTVWENSCAA